MRCQPLDNGSTEAACDDHALKLHGLPRLPQAWTAFPLLLAEFIFTICQVNSKYERFQEPGRLQYVTGTGVACDRIRARHY
jgi:hypothetical protein